MRYATILLLALAGSASMAMAEDTGSPSRSMAFTTAGSLRMTLRVGDVQVVGTQEEKVKVTWTPSRTEDDVEVTLVRDGEKEATLRVEGPSNKVHYRIEVPARTDLVVDMNAGNLDIRGVTGNLDAGLSAGNLEVRVPEPSTLRSARLSVLSGGLTARPWKVDKGGIARSFETQGSGEYDLHARVLAGQLTIR